MIVDDAISVVYRKLKSALTYPVFRYSRPADVTSEAYIVINSLPVGSGILQKCILNVNAWCKDIEPGSPDAKKLAAMTKEAIETLDETENETGDIFIFFQQQNVFPGEELKSHYSNMRFDIRLINS